MVRVSSAAARTLIVRSKLLLRRCCGDENQYWVELLINVVACEDERAVAAGNK